MRHGRYLRSPYESLSAVRLLSVHTVFPRHIPLQLVYHKWACAVNEKTEIFQLAEVLLRLSRALFVLYVSRFHVTLDEACGVVPYDVGAELTAFLPTGHLSLCNTVIPPVCAAV